MIAVIPCKERSTRCPGKNRRTIGGVPLWLRAARFAQSVGVEPVVTTDDAEIARECEALHVRCLRRPERLCRDETPMFDVLVHLFGNVRADSFVLLQPTSPFRLPGQFRRLERMLGGDIVVCTGTPANPMTFVNGKPTFGAVKNSQEWPMAFDGNMLLSSVERLLREKSVYAGRTIVVENPPPYCLQVDTEQEFAFLSGLADRSWRAPGSGPTPRMCGGCPIRWCFRLMPSGRRRMSVSE